MNKLISLLCSLSIATGSLTHAAINPNEPANSALANGKWVKFRIDNDGVYQFTHDQLRSLGFENPAQVKVFGYTPTLLMTHEDAKIPADVAPIVSINENDKIVFYAKANVLFSNIFWDPSLTVSNNEHVRHAHSRGATYFLTESDQSEVLRQIDPPSSDNEDFTEYHKSMIFHEEENNHYGKGGMHYYSHRITNPNDSITYPLILSKPWSSLKGNLIMAFDMTANNNTKNYLVASLPNGWTPQIPSGVNAAGAGSHELYRLSRMYQEVDMAPFEGTFNGSISFKPNPTVVRNFRSGAVDWWAYIYDRCNDLSGESQMALYRPDSSIGHFRLTGMDPEGSWHVWDVTDPNYIYNINLSNNGLGAYAGNDSHALIHVFNTAATLPTPEIVGEVANQNLHALPAPDLLIITTDFLRQGAETLAQIHRQEQGIDVAVIDQQQIFNEYGSGNISPEAVRRFVRHLYNKEDGKLKALMLVGNVCIEQDKKITPETGYVITFQNELQNMIYKETQSFFNDGFFGHVGAPRTNSPWNTRPMVQRLLASPMQVAVGRVPFDKPSDLAIYIDKVRSYFQNAPTGSQLNTVVIASDYEPNANATDGMHYDDAEATIASFGPTVDNATTIIRGYSNFYNTENNTLTRRLVTSGLERGTEFFLYYGHGTNMAIGTTVNTRDFMMTTKRFNEQQNFGRYPHAFIGSCSTANFDISNENLAYSMLAAPHGGMITVVGSNREVYQTDNRLFGAGYIKEYTSAPNGEWIGRAFANNAVNMLNSGSVGLVKSLSNHLCYNFFGDPALPIYGRTNSMALNNVNNDANGNVLFIGAQNSLSGHILKENSNSEIDSDFNGKLHIAIYDVPDTLNNKVLPPANGQYPDDFVLKMKMDHALLAAYEVDVKNGQFNYHFNAPTPSRVGNVRLTCAAASSDGKKRAIGHLSDVQFVYDEEREKLPVSNDAVKINSLICGSGQADMRENPRLVITAEITSHAGISSSNVMGEVMRLDIDNKPCTSAPRLLTYKGNGLYELRYVTSLLSGGKHSCRLSVQDANGTTDEREVEFVVDDAPTLNVEYAYADGILSVTSNSATASGKATLMIEKLDGTLVKRVTGTSFPMQVTTNLPAGYYRVYTLLANDNFHTSSPRQTICID